MERFAVPGQWDAGAFLDDLGMLVAPGYLIGQPDGLVEVEALTGAGSFCLLASPARGRRRPGDHRRRLSRPGRRRPEACGLRSDGRGHRRRGLPGARDRACGCCDQRGNRVTLVLDGLEECPVPGVGKALASLLKQLLREADASAMRLLVGCRSADYPPAVHAVLASAFPGFALYHLAPLRRRDVEELAASRGVPAKDFLEEVARTPVRGRWSSFPLTPGPAASPVRG